MKLLKSLGLVVLGAAAAKLFPEQVDAVYNYVTSIDAESVKAAIGSVRGFIVEIYDVIVGTPASA